ncbi:proliferating cell nuclear antigen (pcna) [Candidatus Pacearchaeota archaeon]|nr:MAG: proliferating cell nuclear antigen (pcna) [Candidatus Pacearchaeota archaeon]
MLIKLDTPQILSKAIEIISELVIEVKIKINESGMNITAIDPANVAMVEFKLPKNAFSQFEVKDEVLGINLDSLKKILKRTSSGSSLIFEKKDKEELLNIQIQDRIKRNFSLNLLEIESEDKKIPQLEYVAKVELDSIDFIASIEDCSVVADACSFIVKDGKFIIEAKGINSAKSEFSGDEAKILAEDCKSRYSLEYLQKFLKAAKLTDKTILKFSADHPLRLEFKDGMRELNFILAPRVETED